MTALNSSSDQASQAAAARGRIEALASQSRAIEAEVLREVIAYTGRGWHRTFDGYSGLRDWIVSCFDFNYLQAGQIARIARLAPKFRALTEAALDGRARIDAVAYAVRQLDVTGLRVWARTAYPAPVPSPYDPKVACATPEELVREHCCHASFAELKDAIAALLAERESTQEAMLDELTQQTLQRVDLWQREDGMWDLDGTLTADTGTLLDNYLKTATPPPRQDQADHDGVLPAQANRHAEALHQLLARAGTDPHAPKRHGHTATLTLLADVDTLRGKATGRVPRLDGQPISVAKTRLLACEAGVVPMVFDYATGEVIEQSRELRVPNVALRRKLEAEQPRGCAWAGCNRPVSWCESHHIRHWLDGGPTTAENLVLLCRFHHGRIHTGQWTVTKTGPGKAVIRHTDGTTDTDWDLSEGDTPTGLFPDEWSGKFKDQLDDFSAWYAMETAAATIRRTRARFKTEALAQPARAEAAPAPAGSPATSEPTPVSASAAGATDYGPPPFLGRPRRTGRAEGRARIVRSARNPTGPGPFSLSDAASCRTSMALASLPTLGRHRHGGWSDEASLRRCA